jgi:hypothetical protein
MKYYKSKRGYFYKIIGDKKIRISIEEYKMKCKKSAIKGGTVQNNGELEKSDFQISVYGQQFIRLNKNPISQHITNDILNSIHLKVIRKPWYLGNEPVIFFGGNPDSMYFSYACYNDSIFSKKINFFELKYGSVNPISIDNILIQDLIELFYGLKNIRKKYPSFMTKLYNTLESEFMKTTRLPFISNIRFTNKNKIKKLTKYSGHDNSYQIKQSLLTLKKFTKNPQEVTNILNRLQHIEKEKNRLWRTEGEVIARRYQQDEFRKLIDSILQKK